MSPGREGTGSPILLTQSGKADYELCALDVLGLADTHENDQHTVYEQFKEQLERNPAKWYEAKLLWKGTHPLFTTNEAGSKRRLEHLVCKRERAGQYQECDNVIQEQLAQGVKGPVPETPAGKEFYIPHKGVVRENAESTKVHIVYNASAREMGYVPSRPFPQMLEGPVIDIE